MEESKREQIKEAVQELAEKGYDAHSMAEYIERDFGVEAEGEITYEGLRENTLLVYGDGQDVTFTIKTKISVEIDDLG